MEANKIEIKVLAISFVIIIFIEPAMRVASTKCLLYPMIILGVARLLEIILLILVVLIWGNGLSSIGLAQSRMVHGFIRGLIWSAGFGIIALIAFFVLISLGINAFALIHMHLPGTPGKITIFFLVGGLVGPIAEEIFFRGILYGFLKRWGVLTALVLSTLMFVLAHPVFPRIPLTQLVGGIVFAVAYEVEGSLIVPITIHVLGNLAIFTISLLP